MRMVEFMAKTCHACGKTINWPDIFNCYYCQQAYCDKHQVAENHDCPKVVAARHIKGDYLRKRGVNITTGMYRAVCEECGFSTDFMFIEQANQLRINHIRTGTCQRSSVKLRQHDEGNREDDTLRL